MENDILITIRVLESLIEQHARELYMLDEAGSRDWKTQYKHQLKIDRINETIKDVYLLKKSN